ncbi:vitellogenin-like [Glandiceps talaboti]
MRFLVLALVIAVAYNTAANVDSKEKQVVTKYKEIGKKYVYNYEGFITTGLPNTGKQQTGLKITCRPEFSFISDEDVLLKLLNTKLYEYINNPNGRQETLLQESTLSHRLNEELSTPIKFRYVNGKVETVFAPEFEPEWILNIKKGILSLLNLDLIDEEDANTFTKIDTDILGECETLYDVTKTTNEEEVHIMNITKFKDMDKCVRKPVSFTSLIKTKTCESCELEETKFLHTGVGYHYNITGTRTDFIIESVRAEGQHLFTPFIKTGGSALTIAKHTMSLVKITNADLTTSTPAMIPRGDLMHVFPKRDIAMTTTTITSQEKVEYFLEMLSRETPDVLVRTEAANHFILLVKSLRECAPNTLKTIIENMKSQSEKKEWLLEALGVVGTRESVQLIKDLIINKKLSDEEIIKLLSSLVNVREPSERILDDIMNICLDNVMNLPTTNLEEVSLKTLKAVLERRYSCFLTFSTLVDKLCQHQTYCPTKYDEFLRNCETTYEDMTITDKIFGIKETIKPLPGRESHKVYTEDLVTIKRNILNEESKLMCLKSMGNAGLKSHADTIIAELKDENNENTLEVRVNAIYALQKIAPKLPKKVQSVLMPVYRNPGEDPELRIAAYLTILNTKPTSTVYTLLAEQIKKETSKQVGMFVFTHLTNLASNKHPYMKTEAKAARMALHFARPFIMPLITQLHFSHTFHWSMYLDRQKMGGSIDVHNIFTHTSIFPRSMKSKLNVFLLGQNIDVLEAGIRTEGLQNFVEKFVGPKGFWERRQSLFDFLKRPRKDLLKTTIRSELDIIKEKMRTKYRKPEEPKGSIYIKLFDDEIMSRTFRKEDIKTLITDGTYEPKMKNIEEVLRQGDHLDFKKATLLLDTEYQEPTILGVPLSLNITSALIMKLKIDGRARIKPSLFNPKPSEIEATSTIISNIVVTMLGKMGVDCTLLKTGVAINASTHVSVPVKASIKSEMEDKKHIVKLYIQEESKRELVSFKHNLYTFLIKDRHSEKYNKIDGTMVNIPQKNITCLTVIKNGLSFCADYEVVPRKTVPDPIFPFTGPSEFNMYSLKGYDSPRLVKFELYLKKHHTDILVKDYEMKVTFVDSPEEESTTFNLKIDGHPEDPLIELKTKHSENRNYESRLTIKMTKPMEEVVFDWEFGEQDHVVKRLSDHEELTSDREYRVLTTMTIPKTDRTELCVKTVYTRLPKSLKMLCKKIEILLPRNLHQMPYSLTIQPKLNKKRHTVELLFKLVSTNTMEAVLSTPLQEIRVTNITLTSPVKTLLPMHIPNSITGVRSTIMKEMILPTCTIDKNNVFKTFDNVTFNYEMPGSCLHVLVKDCSLEERFLVLVQNQILHHPDNSEKKNYKKVIAYVDDNKIELFTTPADIPEVKVNGNKVVLDEYNKMRIDIPNLAAVMRNESDIAVTTSIGLDIYYNKHFVHTQVNAWYFNKTCGLCGDYNGEEYMDLKTPDDVTATGTNLFGLSWLVEGEDDDCTLKKKKIFTFEEEVYIGGQLPDADLII